MISAKKVLERNKITYWLDGGTLLWAVRDGSPDETDTDFSIWFEDRERIEELKDEFKEEGLDLVATFKNSKLGTVEYAFKKNGKKVDIFLKQVEGEKAYHIATDGESSIFYTQPAYHFDTLDTVEMGGETWPIPNDVENYLETYYGDTWRTHISDWDWRVSSPCIDKEWKI